MTSLTDSFWKALCCLRDAINENATPVSFCSLQFGEHVAVHLNGLLRCKVDCHDIVIAIAGERPGAHFTVENFLCRMTKNASVPSEVQQLAEIYAPYCLAPLFARQLHRAFVVSHFAQSLDGRIATISGDSKWIGNDQNLVHAHRMRALCDGVLVGKNTLQYDRPQLTVRHVEGSNPIRIVLGASRQEVSALWDIPLDSIWDLGKTPIANPTAIVLSQQKYSSLEILQLLYENGIYSLYLEGGAATASQFLQEQTIDILQLHVSPIIIGSGVSCFSLPTVDKIDESIRFVDFMYVPVGDAIMFVGTTDNG